MQGRLNARLAIVMFCFLMGAASAQISRWDTGEVISGTEGITPGPGMNMQNWNSVDHNLQYADFSGGLDLSGSILKANWLDSALFTGANLTDAQFGVEMGQSSLTNADFSNANLTNVSMNFCPVTGADFSGATIRSISLIGTGGLTHSQLYSTASYQQADFRGIGFYEINLAGFDFSGLDLSNASLTDCHIEGADFSGAKIQGLYMCKVSEFSQDQFYSTKSYQVKNLYGIHFGDRYNMSGWDFSDQYLADSNFDFSILTHADFSRSDTRGAELLVESTMIMDNSIFPNGRIYGLDLLSGDDLKIRDYSGDVAISIRYEMLMESGSSLTVQFEDADWGSTISLEEGIEVDLDGKLMLMFAEGTDVESLVGTTFDLFDWNGTLEPDDAFACVDWNEWAQWDISDLYEGGTVTLTAAPEPASLLLLVFGSLISCRRRRMGG